MNSSRRRDDVGALEDPQYRRHRQIAGRKAVAIKIGLVAA